MAQVNTNPVPNCNRPIVWTIAGSDSGGGAGIQADLATINDLDAHGCSAITAVTAQSSVIVASVEAVSPQMLIAQLDVLAADLAPKAIKIGLLASQQQIDLLAGWLTESLLHWQERGLVVPVILDPVMVATCGDALTGAETLDFTPLKGLLTLITPNVTELATLAGRQLLTAEESVQAAETLAAQLQTSVLAKGGDIGPNWHKSYSRDLLVCPSSRWRIKYA